MNVYAETNFVLEMALKQEYYYDCQKIMELCQDGKINLIIPAYSIVEPYETLIRRHRNRKKLKSTLDLELNQLLRTDSYTDKIVEIKSLVNILILSTEDEMKRIEIVRTNLLEIVEIIPLNVNILKSSTKYQQEHDLSPQDAIIYASILDHLKVNRQKNCCFLNKNSKDFDDPDILEELENFDCKMLSRFDHGYQFIVNQTML